MLKRKEEIFKRYTREKHKRKKMKKKKMTIILDNDKNWFSLQCKKFVNEGQSDKFFFEVLNFKL